MRERKTSIRDTTISKSTLTLRYRSGILLLVNSDRGSGMPEKRYESQKRWNSENYKQINIAVRPELATAFRAACEKAQTPMREAFIKLMTEYCAAPPVLKEGKGKGYPDRSSRRKATANIIGQLGKIRGAEEEYKRKIPENLRNSTRYEAAEQAIEALDEAIDILGDAFK